MPHNKRTLLTIGALSVLLALGAVASATAPVAMEAPGFTTDKSAKLASKIDPSKPRNVILLIGDGTDDSMITAARNYQLGADGRFALDDLPFTGAMTTHGLKVGPGPDYPIAYVSDSAPTASGWSTGKKTVDGRLSQGPSTADTVPGVDYPTVLEILKAQGKRVGNITTSEITDATPAAAGSHINARACHGPANMANCTPARKVNGGKGSIAEQLVDNKIDVLMGGGKARYDQSTDAGPTVLSYAQSAHNYRLVQDAASMNAITSLTGGPVLGLFAPVNMTPMYNPLVAAAAPAIAGGPTTRCTNADRSNQPDLSSMTQKAISLLDNPNGFFLQVESAMVDKQEHASDICGAIGDLVELDEAVQVALNYQETHPDTLIIVTGDHAHSTQIVGGNTDDGKQLAQLQTADGDPMTVAYSTNAVGSDHTGTQIRVAASGPQAANVTGTIDQTDLFLTMLGRTPSTLPGTTPAKPDVAIAAPRKIDKDDLKKRGVTVAVAAAASTKVTVQLLKDGKVLATVTLGSSGGDARLKAKATGKLTIVATATGPGGTSTDAQTLKVT